MDKLPFTCPEGYTCDLDIYPMWWDIAGVALVFLLLIGIIVVFWRMAR